MMENLKFDLSFFLSSKVIRETESAPISKKSGQINIRNCEKQYAIQVISTMDL